eukprot:gene7710-9484_t
MNSNTGSSSIHHNQQGNISNRNYSSNSESTSINSNQDQINNNSSLSTKSNITIMKNNNTQSPPISTSSVYMPTEKDIIEHAPINYNLQGIHPYFESQPTIKILSRKLNTTPVEVAAPKPFKTLEEKEIEYQKARALLFKDDNCKNTNNCNNNNPNQNQNSPIQPLGPDPARGKGFNSPRGRGGKRV